MLDTFKNTLEGAVAAAKNHQTNAAKEQMVRLVTMYRDAIASAETAEAAEAKIWDAGYEAAYHDAMRLYYSFVEVSMEQQGRMAAEIATLRAQIAELQATIVGRNKTITEREAEIADWQDSYYGLEERIDELEEAARWRPISEPPSAAGEYLGWNGYRVEIVRYLPEYEDDETDWPWRDWCDDEINISQWVSFSAPPTEAPAP